MIFQFGSSKAIYSSSVNKGSLETNSTFRRFPRISIAFLLTFIASIIYSIPASASAVRTNPISYMPEDEPGLETYDRQIPSFAQFIASLAYGSPDQVVGLYIPKVIAVPVVQQPPNDPAFVSNLPNIVTQFRLADLYGSKGFLAHDNKVGKSFVSLESGNQIFLVLGDKSIRTFMVSELLSFKALSPMSPYSRFRYVEKPNATISTEELFYQIYGKSGRIILQTCIEANGNPYWGRYFVVAIPRDNFQYTGLRLQP